MPSPDIDTDLIEQLALLLQRSGLSEIEVAQGETRIRVARQIQPVDQLHMVAPAAQPPAAANQVATALPLGAEEEVHPGTILSPMVGTVYLAGEPGSPPFVQVGDTVREGQTLVIIEAMKVMNAIRATKPGRVSRILVENAAPVEYGEPLMVIE